MKAMLWLHNRIVAALLPVFLACALAATAVFAEDAAKLDDLFTRLKTADAAEAGRIEAEIELEWSKSGSPTMDLLYKRGEDALAVGNTTAAIEHFTALLDQDPDFTEGWNARATAYYTAGEIGPSLADIAHVLQVNPRHFGAMAGLALILEETGKPDQALQVYRAAQAIHPHLQVVNEAIERLEKTLEGQEL
ncbi:MAG: tetratricopeptide repeat protein [Paracoccaceae bacterium]|mgnify:CR=1 FL=1|jgi:tetratricopeptide (TPR) repeat protein